MWVTTRALRILLVLIASVYVLATAAVMAGTDVATSYAATSVWLGRTALAAGMGLVGAGSFVWLGGRRGAVGPVAMALGVVWLAGDWVGWAGGSELARSLGALVLPLLAPLLLHLAVALPDGEISDKGRRVVLLTVYGLVAVLSLAHAALYDPVLDLGCWRTCSANVFLVHADPGLAAVLARASEWVTLGVAAAAVVLAARRTADAVGSARRSFSRTLIPVGAAGTALAAWSVLLLLRPAEDPTDPVFATTYAGLALALIGLGVGLGWTELAAVRVRRRVASLARDLANAPGPGSLESVLRTTLGDPSLMVAYPLSGGQSYVDADGHRVQPGPTEGSRATVSIVRAGEPVALVTHDSGIGSSAVLEREIGASARLAVDNERLRAQLLAQVEDLRASRARVVSAADAARQEIERNLHDGAQQRLLALTYELRLARADAEATGDRESARTLTAACDQAQAALIELRELAHGIYPAILAEAGLAAAVRTLADSASIAVVLRQIPDQPWPPAVARAAYVVVSDAVDAATRAGAGHVAVNIEVQEETLVVSVTGMAAEGDRPLMEGSVTRIEALGGHLDVRDGTVRGEIPCV